jgi:Bacterial Ig-like domain (group 2)
MHSDVRTVAARAFVLGLLVIGTTRCSEHSDIGPGRVLAVRVFPDSLTLDVGQMSAIRAFPIDADSAFLPAKKPTWSSDQSGIVSVDDTGAVTGVALGTTDVRATVDGISGAATITVGPPEIGFDGLDTARFTTIELDPSPAALLVPVHTQRLIELAGLAVGTITYGSGATGWLQATLDQPATPATLTLTPSTSGFAAGTYHAQVPLTATNAGTPPASLEVLLVVGTGPTIGLNPATTDLSAMAGGADPAAVPVQVTNTGGGNLTGLAVGTIGYGPGATGWITGATLDQATAPATLTIQGQVGALGPGSYTATIPITSAAAVNSPQAVTVTFTVTN